MCWGRDECVRNTLYEILKNEHFKELDEIYLFKDENDIFSSRWKLRTTETVVSTPRTFSAWRDRQTDL